MSTSNSIYYSNNSPYSLLTKTRNGMEKKNDTILKILSKESNWIITCLLGIQFHSLTFFSSSVIFNSIPPPPSLHILSAPNVEWKERKDRVQRIIQKLQDDLIILVFICLSLLIVWEKTVSVESQLFCIRCHLFENLYDLYSSKVVHDSDELMVPGVWGKNSFGDP